MRARPTAVSVIGWLVIWDGIYPLLSIGFSFLVVKWSVFLMHRLPGVGGSASGLLESRFAHFFSPAVMAELGVSLCVAVGCGTGLLRGWKIARWAYVAWLAWKTVRGAVYLAHDSYILIPFLVGCLSDALAAAFLFLPRSNRWFSGDDSDPGDAYGPWTVVGFLLAMQAFNVAALMLPRAGLPYLGLVSLVAALAGLGLLGVSLAATGWRNSTRDTVVVAAGVALSVGPMLPVAFFLSRHPEARLSVSRSFPMPPGRSYREASSDLAAAGASQRFLLLGPAAKAAFDTGRFDEARQWASELKEAIPDHVGEEGFGEAVQDGNVVLGRLALRDGDVEGAKERLLAAGRSSGSPSMDDYGPNVGLAADLLEKGETETVLRYFDLCRSFWKDDHGKLDAWTEAVRQGRKPDFGANLIY